MFKRKPRVLFTDVRESAWPERAANLATELGHELIDVWHSPVEALGDCGDMAWADLIVTLSSDADRLCPPLSPNNQKRNWFEEGRDISDGALRDRINGMLGGIRLLRRLDADGETP